MAENFYDIPYIPDNIEPSALEIIKVYKDFEEGRSVILDAFRQDKILYLKWLREQAGDIDQDWFEPMGYLNGLTNFELLAGGWNDSRESWVLHSLHLALIALNGGIEQAMPEVKGQAGPSWIEEGQSARGYSCVVNETKLILEMCGLTNEEIIEKSKLALHQASGFRGLPAQQSYGGVVVGTTTAVAQLTHLASTIGSVYNRWSLEPDALIVQAWRTPGNMPSA